MQDSQDSKATQLTINRTYPAAPEKVWRAWTDPQALKRWFGPGENATVSVAEIDLRVGGRYRIAFGAPDGETHEASGEYQEVVPNRRLVFSWAWKGTPERVSRVTIELKPVAEGTELSFVHDRFCDTKARDNHAKGWPPFFDKLGTYLRT